jgi:ABC-type Fe3+ transport system permease subunit
VYRPKQGREEEQRTHRPEQGQFIRAALPVLTVVFCVAAAICVVMIAVYAFTQSMGAWLSWMTGISFVDRNGLLRRYRVDRVQEQP